MKKLKLRKPRLQGLTPDEKDQLTLIYQMLSRQNALVIDKLFPWLERLEDNLKILHRATGERFDPLEKAVADLAAAIYLEKNGRRIDEDVRPH